MNSRLSVPSTCPHAFARSRSKVAPRPISVIGAVVPRFCGPEVLRTPWASVQQIGMIFGVVLIGAETGPTLWHDEFCPSWRMRAAFESSARVGGLLGSSCAIRLSTTGVYGAAGSIGGAVRGSGRLAGIE